MLSTKVDQRRIVGKNPFTNSMTPYQKYLMDLENNTYQLKQRFPLEEGSKIKSLLEELDNNAEMVADILEEELAREIPLKKENNRPKLPPSEQNAILKSAFLRLYRKLIKKEKECQEVGQRNERLKKENESLKLQNQLLLNQKYTSCYYNGHADIC